MKFIELESERLIYRKFNDNDFSEIFDMLKCPESMRYRREPHNEAESRDFMQWAISNAEADECKNFTYAAVQKDNNAFIGWAMLLDTPRNPGIGWSVRKNYWRQGYGTEMGKTMLKLGFDILSLRRIIAGCCIPRERINARRAEN